MNTAQATDRAFDTYQRVRDAVLRMKASAVPSAPKDEPSRYWSEELENFDYMIEATPLVVRKLRQHAFHITGIRPSDYLEAPSEHANFERRLRALVALGGRELLVPESPALGGFGFRIDGALFNVDTLKFYEVLVGMSRSGVLEPFRQSEAAGPNAAAGRPVVWEIGGGWGGFAYQFKTLWPKTTYVIVDFPELFLYSATYLGTMFPDARVRFWGGEGAQAEWADADFIFIPVAAASAVRSLRPGLLVNLVSFQEMTEAQVDAYARLAADSGCPALYSLNRERSRYSDEIQSVSQVLSRYYDLEEVAVLDTEYTKATKKDSVDTAADVQARARRSGKIGELNPYRHLAGRLQADHAAVARVREAASDGRRVAIGATLFNRSRYLPEALDSLLAQTYSNFRLLLLDDGSTDDTERIAREYAARDPRVVYVRNPRRLGMVATWRRAFELAAGEGVEYFAWASDHDRWHPEWLATLVSVLDRHPAVVLAYPQTQRISPGGEPLAKPARMFDTFGVTSVRSRWIGMSTTRSLAAGDMVYGVMRTGAVRASGIFRDVLSPDRLLMAELTIRGQIHQVPVVLWYRRQFETGSVARQKHTLFAPGGRPRGAGLPPWLQHARVLWREYGSSPETPLGASRTEARRLIARYAAAYATRHHRKTTVHRRFAGFLESCRYVYKRAKHAVLLAVFYTLVYGRRAFWGGLYYTLVGLRRIGLR